MNETQEMRCKLIFDAEQWGYHEPVLVIYNDYYLVMRSISQIERDSLQFFKRGFKEGEKAEKRGFRDMLDAWNKMRAEVPK